MVALSFPGLLIIGGLALLIYDRAKNFINNVEQDSKDGSPTKEAINQSKQAASAVGKLFESRS